MLLSHRAGLKRFSNIISQKKRQFGRGRRSSKIWLELEMGYAKLKKQENAEIFHLDLFFSKCFIFSFPNDAVHRFLAAHLPKHHPKQACFLPPAANWELTGAV